MLRAPQKRLSESSAAHVHRMLKSDALPSHLHSVVNGQGQLTSSAEELESVMVDHFSSVFAMPPPDPAPLPHPPPAMLFDKEQCARRSGSTVSWRRQCAERSTAALADAQFVSSPGEDGVSTGLWKLALQGSDVTARAGSAAVLRLPAHSFFPSAWKTSVIVPLRQGRQEGAHHEQRAPHQPAELPRQAAS